MAIKIKKTKVLRGSRGKDITICECHAHLVERYKWNVSKNGYVSRSTWRPRTMVYMHRVIANAPKGRVVDHINGDTLYNVCWNLRLVSQHENCANARFWRHNTSGYKGVCWHKQSKCWRAYITVGQKQKSLGLFDDILDAVKARQEAEEQLWGEYAWTNIVAKPRQ